MAVRPRTWVTADGKRREALVIDVKAKGPDGQVLRHRTTCPTLNRTDAKNLEKAVRNAITNGLPLPRLDGDAAPEPVEEPSGVEPKRTTSACPTVKVYWQKFMERAAKDNSPAEIVNKENCARYFLPRYSNKKLSEVDSDVLEDFDAALAKEGLAPKTRKNMRGIVKRMLKMAVRAGHITGVPVTDPIRVPQVKGRALTEAETQALHDACTHPEVQLIIFLAWKVGLRIGEVLGLTWTDIHWEKGTLTLRRFDGAIRRSRVKEKRDEPGPLKEAKFLDADPIIPLFDEVLERLRPLRKKSGYIVAHEDGNYWHYWEIRRPLNRAYKAAGLPPLAWHTLRRSFVTQKAETGVPVPIISKLVTHKSTTMTDRYLNVSDQQLLDFVRGKRTAS